MTGGYHKLAVVAVVLGLAGCGGFGMDLNPFDGDEQQSTIRSVPQSVIVDSDDTVQSIARDYNLSTDDIIDLNKLQKPYRLKKGSRLMLPRPRGHVVQRGETLGAIAKAYGVSNSEIASLNGLASPYRLSPGDRLRLPGGKGVTSDSVENAAAAKEQSAPDAEQTVGSQGVSSAGFVWPARGRLLSRFGRTSGGTQNDGINIALSSGSRIRAAGNGVVAYSGNEIRGFGNLLLIKHSGGWVSAYAHNSKLLVGKGTQVKRGQAIALSGKSGGASSPQLHFELRKNGKAVDPLRYLP